MKKLLVCVLSCLVVFSLFGCGAKEEVPDTLGNALKAQFEEEVKKTTDVVAIAEALSKNEKIEFAAMSMEVEPGYLAGFSTDVTGFTKGAMAGPMIGTIPCVIYVFEADDAAAFLETIKGIADPRWNICTEAGETVYATSGNIVFFAMCPATENE